MTRALPVGAGRWYFFVGIRERCPWVMNDLAKNVLPPFCRLADRSTERDLKRFLLFLKDSGGSPLIHSDLSGEQLKLKIAIENWQERWNLTDDWIFDLVIKTLSYWSQDNEAIATMGLPTYYPEEPDPWELEPDFSPILGDPIEGRWSPQEEPRREARSRLVKMATKCIDDYLARVEEQIATPRASKAATHAVEDYALLAAYQVGELSLSELEKETNMTRGGIHQLLNSLAESIGLTLREPLPAGRPRKGETGPRRFRR